MNFQIYNWFIKLRGKVIRPKPLTEPKPLAQNWGLYDEPITRFHATTLFPFIDQYATLGSHNTQLEINVGEDAHVASITICNLNNYANEKTIINTLIHESLHIAICFCLMNQSEFVEHVINNWMMKRNVVMENNRWKVEEKK